jgi:hypothetical protein
MRNVPRSLKIAVLLGGVPTPAWADGGRIIIPIGLILFIVIFVIRFIMSSTREGERTSNAGSTRHGPAIDPEPTPLGSKVVDHQGRTVIIHPDGRVRAMNQLGWRSFASVDEYLAYVGAKSLGG